MDIKYGVWVASGYKILINFIRIVLGSILLYFGDVDRTLGFLFSREIRHDPNDFIFNFLINHVNDASHLITIILAICLIGLSIMDLFFIIALLFRRKWGAIGFFIVTLFWIPVELFFIGRFLSLPKLFGFLINIVILILLYRLLHSSRHYFKK